MIILNHWLQKRLDVDDIDEYFTTRKCVDFLTGEANGPRTIIPEEFIELQQRMLPNDELWEFNTPDEFWKGMCGRKGVALVGDGRIVDEIVTLMN